jgi:hypothetical protein
LPPTSVPKTGCPLQTLCEVIKKTCAKKDAAKGSDNEDGDGDDDVIEVPAPPKVASRETRAAVVKKTASPKKPVTEHPKPVPTGVSAKVAPRPWPVRSFS